MKLFSDNSKKFNYKGVFLFKSFNTNEDIYNSSFKSDYPLILNDKSELFPDPISEIISSEKEFVQCSKVTKVSILKSFVKSKRLRSLKSNLKDLNKRSSFNIGRWTEDEHMRFIEAMIKYGNDWKSVQKYIKTRSTTQARSHSQKFFIKLKSLNVIKLANPENEVTLNNFINHTKTMTETEKKSFLKVLMSLEYDEAYYDSVKLQSASHIQKLEVIESQMQCDMEYADCQFVFEKRDTPSTSINQVSSDEDINTELRNIFQISNRRKTSFDDNCMILYMNTHSERRKVSFSTSCNNGNERHFDDYINFSQT